MKETSAPIMSQQDNLKVIESFWQAFDVLDFDAAGALLHDDYVEEWPQSGERIRGRANFVTINKLYPDHWHVTILRMIATGDTIVSEVRLEHKDELVFAISFFEFKDGRIYRETDYWPEPYQPPAWRAQWVEH